jgi:peroxiredoxin Q/BCP
MLAAGDRAPAFTLDADDGARMSLRGLKGRTVVLYFYPKDDTAGCTTQACEFRGRWKAVQSTGAVLLGVSPDGVESHRKFRRKYRLPFPLLADGVWGEKSMYGRTYMGILRTTFIISGTGRILAVFPRVRPKGHAAEVLAALHEVAV